jgi:predicted metal-dependent phosphoesterase TrpH
MSERIKVDFHLHTHYSIDSLTRVEDLIRTARARGLGKIAITDHNSMQGALKAYQLDPEFVIVGEEILTTHGEILGYYLQEEIPARLSPAETLQRLKDQNAFISIPHAFDPFRSQWHQRDLEEIVDQIDALEVLNARCFSDKMNERAQRFAEEHHLAGTAGSDGHWHKEVGTAFLTLPQFTNSDELRVAIKQAKVSGHRSPFWVRFYSSYVRFRRILSR